MSAAARPPGGGRRPPRRAPPPRRSIPADPPGPGQATLGRRAATIAWGLPVVVGCLWAGGWFLALGGALLALAALREFWGLGRAFGVPAGLRWEVALAALVVLAGAELGPARFDAGLATALVLVVAGGVVRAAATRSGADLRAALGGSVWAILGTLYIPWLLGFVLLIRQGAPGALDVPRSLALIAFVWCPDVVAFLVGARFGRHRLALPISPGKSVEGAVVAVAVAAVLGAAGSRLVGLPVWAGGGIGAAVGLAGLVGDLWESLLKRGAEVKDSGGGLPGHGGVLDRFDSLLLAAPAAYWLFDRVPWSAFHLLGR